MAGNSRSIVYITLLCVSNAQETNTVLYDSSAVATTLNISDPLKSTILSIRYSTTSSAGKCQLNWDATTPIVAWALPYQSNDGTVDFTCIGGLTNLGGAGITGDVTLTTTGLVSGEAVTLVLEVRPN